jgi:tetratricopeptide (TPR) repeat protein
MLESDNYIHLYRETDEIDYLNKGISLMEHSITLAPLDYNLHNHLGNLYLLSGNLERAEEHLEIAAKYNIYSANIFIDLANFYSSQNRYEEAEEILLLADSRKEFSIKAATNEEKESRVFEASLVNSYLYLLYKNIGDNENMKIQVEELYSMAEEYAFLNEYYKLENFIY